MLNGRPPYKALLTHGFAVDGEGRKMSKSKGNGVEPQKVSSTLGAEILRLWVAATDYSGELYISDEILKRVVEGYRRIRNTLRFLLANTSDFDPGQGSRSRSASSSRSTVTRWQRPRRSPTQRQADLRTLRIPCRRAAPADVLFRGSRRVLSRRLKDRLYTTGKDSAARRSAQTALALIRDALLAADGARALVHCGGSVADRRAGRRSRSSAGPGSTPCRGSSDADALTAKWSRILAVRAAVLKELETLRQGSKIGSSLQAEVAIGAADATTMRLRASATISASC
jgi:isoleucyl-tRNA synthetase